MKKEARIIYRELASEINAPLCTFCKYAGWIREGCCEGYAECSHPIDRLSYINWCEDSLEPEGDCYGFRPNLSIALIADIVGAIISQGYNGGWFYRVYSPTSATVYGQWYNKEGLKTGKIRIG